MSDIDNFRQEVKEWLDQNCPPSMKKGADPAEPGGAPKIEARLLFIMGF